MPPHSSTGASRGSRPWITSHTKLPITPTRFFRVINLAPASSRLQLAQLLLLERSDGAHDAGGEGKCAGYDPARLHGRLERAAPHLGAERLEQRVSRLGHAARQHHCIRVEDVEQIRDTRAEETRRFTHD